MGNKTVVFTKNRKKPKATKRSISELKENAERELFYAKVKYYSDAMVLRPVGRVKGYDSHEDVCNYIAKAFTHLTMESMETGKIVELTKKNSISLRSMIMAGVNGCPTYWVGKDLLRSLLQSEINNIENLDGLTGQEAGILMLPYGEISDPLGASCTSIYWYYDRDRKALYWNAKSGDNFFGRRYQFGTKEEGPHIYSEGLPDEQLCDFNSYLQSVLIRLLLVKQTRPEMLDDPAQQKSVVAQGQGFGAQSEQKLLYSPLWLGKNYRSKSQGTATGTGSKSPHWRRGFIRNQRHGPGLQSTKLIWIEPVMVLGNTG